MYHVLYVNIAILYAVAAGHLKEANNFRLQYTLVI